MPPKTKKLLLKASSWLPVAFWVVLIFHLSSGSIPSVTEKYWQEFAIKKGGHLILFGIMAVLMFRAFRMEGFNRKRAFMYAIILTILYGASDEYHQMYTFSREPRVRDVFIDAAGVGIACLVLNYLPALAPRKLRMAIAKLNLD